MQKNNFFCFITDINELVVQIEFRDSNKPYTRFEQSGVPRELFNPEDVKLGMCFHVEHIGEDIKFIPFDKKEWSKEDLDEVERQVEKYLPLFNDEMPSK